jgi:hypothetical protein
LCLQVRLTVMPTCWTACLSAAGLHGPPTGRSVCAAAAAAGRVRCWEVRVHLCGTLCLLRLSVPLVLWEVGVGPSEAAFLVQHCLEVWSFHQLEHTSVPNDQVHMISHENRPPYILQQRLDPSCTSSNLLLNCRLLQQTVSSGPAK